MYGRFLGLLIDWNYWWFRTHTMLMELLPWRRRNLRAWDRHWRRYERLARMFEKQKHYYKKAHND